MVRGKVELTATLLKMSWGFLATSRSVPMKTMFTPPLNSKRKCRNCVELDAAGRLTHSLSLPYLGMVNWGSMEEKLGLFR